MISEVNDAEFMVMVENGKCGPDIKNALVTAGIPYIYIDDFCTGNCYDMTVSLVLSEIRHDVCTELRTNMDKKEKQVFYDRFIKTMHLCIGETGDATLELGR